MAHVYHFSLLILALVVIVGSKAVPYGDERSAQTLFPRSESANIDGPQAIGPKATQLHTSGHDIAGFADTDVEENDALRESFHIPNKTHFQGDDHRSARYGDHEEATASKDTLSLEERQAPQYRGTMQIDCLLAPGVCKNAGFYQNCLRSAHGRPGFVIYQNGPYDEQVTRQNRIHSGVTLQGATPCNGWPFAQRFWHPQNGGLQDPKLQTDEWPMATFQNAQFNPNAVVPQVSLRCIPYYENSAGGTAWSAFRRCQGPYDPRPTSKAYKKYRGKYAYGTRRGPCSKLAPGDWFDVNFNFSSFSPRGQNATEDAIFDDLSYARGPFPQSCSNDGLQFHLGSLSGSGRWDLPYDTMVHNAYRLAYVAEDIQQYHIRLTVTGNNFDDIKVDVWRMHSTQETLAAKSGVLAVGSSLVVQSRALPLPLTITRTSCRYEFTYGNPSTDGLRWFSFHSGNLGYEAHPSTKTTKPVGQYCETTTFQSGSTIECSFPGW